MGFFSSLTISVKKSIRLQKLQKEISPINQNAGDLIADFKQSIGSGFSARNKALEEFLDLCESDEGVSKIMLHYNLNRIDLKNIYVRLNSAGLDQYIKGHHAALSTIAYYEPLLYVVESERRGNEFGSIVRKLILYWDGIIPQKGLLKTLE